jgi:hypothetical protein
VARYRAKSPDDLAWNRTRRRITRDLDTRIQNFREELLDTLLTSAWERYVKALETGETVQLEDEASRWVDDILVQHLPESADGDLADHH